MASLIDTPEGRYGFCNNLEEYVYCPFELERTKINDKTSLIYATRPDKITVSRSGIEILLPNEFFGELNYGEYRSEIKIDKNLINNKLPFKLTYDEIVIYDIILHKDTLIDFKMDYEFNPDPIKQVETLILKMCSSNQRGLNKGLKLLEQFEEKGSFTIELRN
ncbi:hypothetical protein KY334_03215 [Candidatus Woesearchaeota archaeon]|nr:hypothetical protein [Candidatus Woesearchaeota archaeon]